MKSVVLVYVVLGAFLVACGGKNDPVTAASAPMPIQKGNDDLPHSKTYTGKLYQSLQNIQSSKYLEDCESSDDYKAKQLELASALDEKQEAIQAFRGRSQSTDEVPRSVVKIGNISTVMIEKQKPDSFLHTGKYTSEYDNWMEAYDQYRKIKELPVGKEWANLDAFIRDTISDDEARVVKNQDFENTRDGEIYLPMIVAAVQGCQRDSNCTEPKVEGKANEYFNRIGLYREYMKTVLLQKSKEKKREWIEKFSKVVAIPFRRFEFVKEKSVVRTLPSQIEVPLQSNDIDESGKTLISKIVSEIWTSKALSVKLRWSELKENLNLFKVLGIRGEFGRSEVSRKKRSVHFYDFFSSRSAAHEIGHVLGFPDHYYSYFDARTCRYKGDSDSDDLMSSPRTGEVTAKEWEELDRQYPFKR